MSAVLGALEGYHKTVDYAAAGHRDGGGAHRISLIQGPPGTGKSTASVALLKLAAMSSESPLLACADSNAACDNLLEGMLSQGVNAVRIGRPGRAAAHLWASTVEAQLESLPEHAELEEQRQQLRMLRVFAAEQVGAARRETEQVLRDGWRRVRKDEQMLIRRLLEQAEVVVSTLVGCGSPAMLGMRFPMVVVDECTQATEPRTLIALARAMASVVLVGDQRQLAPTVISKEAAQSGLMRSLFERLALAAPGVGTIDFSLLTIQYRMHPLLRRFPSDAFYSGQLTDGVDASQRQPPEAFPGRMVVDADSEAEHASGECKDESGTSTVIASKAGLQGVEPHPSKPASKPASKPEQVIRSPLAFLDLPHGREESGRHGVSKLNRREAAAIAEVAVAMLARGRAGSVGDGDRGDEECRSLRPADIGIITPYAAQAAEIRKVLRRRGVPPVVEVRTVDGFQGREKEVILFSCVRANQRGRLGFLSDERRLNVGLTRARRGLFVVGCKRTLRNDPSWAAFVNHCERLRCVLSTADLMPHGIVIRGAEGSPRAKSADVSDCDADERRNGDDTDTVAGSRIRSRTPETRPIAHSSASSS